MRCSWPLASGCCSGWCPGSGLVAPPAATGAPCARGLFRAPLPAACSCAGGCASEGCCLPSMDCRKRWYFRRCCSSCSSCCAAAALLAAAGGGSRLSACGRRQGNGEVRHILLTAALITCVCYQGLHTSAHSQPAHLLRAASPAGRGGPGRSRARLAQRVTLPQLLQARSDACCCWRRRLALCAARSGGRLGRSAGSILRAANLDRQVRRMLCRRALVPGAGGVPG
jgi:hypothetical protein